MLGGLHKRYFLKIPLIRIWIDVDLVSVKPRKAVVESVRIIKKFYFFAFQRSGP